MAKQRSGNINEMMAVEIVDLINKQPNKTYNYKQIAALLGVKDPLGREVISRALPELVKKGVLIEVEHGKYKLKPVKAYMEGKIEMIASGAAYLLNEEDEEDVYIAAKNVKHALHGDRVKIYLYAKRSGRKLEGEVVEVIERAKSEFVGIVKVSPRFAFLIPDSPKMQVDIFIPLQSLEGAKDGQKAIAEIVEWQKGVKNPEGKITKILGWPGDNDTEMDAILVEYGFPTEFPRDVEQEAEKLQVQITETEIAKRRDFRKITTFTIDPADAKDFDDALSMRKLENGNWEIGVHIADVSHYIHEDSLLEKEAYERATSIYLVDRVIPMLPEMLSNGVCSLRPNEDKLTFSAVFEMEDDGTLVNEWFGRTIIHSIRRFTYEEAQEVIETGKGDLSHEITNLDRLAKILRAERFKKGAISFDRVEVKFRLNEKGDPLGVYLKENKDSNKLIEEFMLLANRKVAEFVGKKKQGEIPKTFVYRIHDSPVTDRLSAFATFASKFGYKLNINSDKEIAASLNNLLKQLSGKKEQNVLETLAIRTMSKAAYTTENIGHYGLAFDFYSHFTSPIRRYPDVMAHRLLERYLKGGKSVDAQEYEKKCKHSTEMEIRAAEAERASVKYKQVQFLEKHVGEFFEGMISGVTEWGIYVELNDNKCEGMVRLRDIANDFYEFDEANYCIVGSRTGRKFQLGDPVKVRLKNTDLIKKQIDFELISDENAGMVEGQSFETEFEFNKVKTLSERPWQHKREGGKGKQGNSSVGNQGKSKGSAGKKKRR